MIEDSPAMVAHGLTRPDLMIIGDAAGFTLSMGPTIRGVDSVTGSALAAAEVIEKAFQTMDFDQQSIDQYCALLDESFVDKDMATYTKTSAFLERPRVYKDYGKLVAEVFYGIFSHGLTPRRHIRRVGPDALKAPGLKLTQIVGDAFAGIRTL